MPEVIFLSPKWRGNSKEVFWVQTRWSGPRCTCPVTIPVFHPSIAQSLCPLVWGYFDAVLGGTVRSFSELSLKGTVSFGSKSVRL